MPEVTTMEWETLSRLGGMYTHACFMFGDERLNTSAWVQKSARKWICKHYADTISAFPEDIRRMFAPEISNQDLFAFLAACVAENSRRACENLDAQKAAVEPLGKAVQHAVLDMQADDDGGWMCRMREDGSAVVMVDGCAAFRRSLVLENAILSKEVAERKFICNIASIKREGDWYILYEEHYDYAEHEAIRFTNARIQVDCYDCTKGVIYWYDAWGYLQMLAWDIIRKAELPGKHCNDREKALLPLLREIKQFGIFTDYPLLTELAEQTGCRSAAFDKVIAKCGKMNLFRKVAAMSRLEFEPLLRAIYERIRRSQEGYPVETEQRCDRVVLEKTRVEIQSYMEQHGFTGQYPDFYKCADIPGLHSFESYDRFYLCGGEKNVDMFIHCMEFWSGDEGVQVHFLCGNALKRKGSRVQDIFGCLFDARGYRWCTTVRDIERVREQKESRTEQSALRAVQVAVKMVQLQKLTKEERKHYGKPTGRATCDFRVLLGCGLFFVGFVPFFMLLGVVILAIAGDWDQIPHYLSSAPWGWMLAGCCTLFGLPVGLIALFAKR